MEATDNFCGILVGQGQFLWHARTIQLAQLSKNERKIHEATDTLCGILQVLLPNEVVDAETEYEPIRRKEDGL
jgi:hypothetical protein